MSAAVVVRSSCNALRRPPLFPRALMAAMERQLPPLPRENLSVRRFHSSDRTVVGKPAETKTTATATAVEDGGSTSDKFDKIIRSLDELGIAWKEMKRVEQEDIMRARGRKVLAGTVVAGLLAAFYVKRRFFGGAKQEDKETVSTMRSDC